jgi:hypothetical protein
MNIYLLSFDDDYTLAIYGYPKKGKNGEQSNIEHFSVVASRSSVGLKVRRNEENC